MQSVNEVHGNTAPRIQVDRQPIMPPLEPLPLLLLLSRDLQSGGLAVQMALPGFGPSLVQSLRRRKTSSFGPTPVPEDDDIQIYLRRLRSYGAATKGMDAYRYQLRNGQSSSPAH
jgi:hypothetical protein